MPTAGQYVTSGYSPVGDSNSVLTTRSENQTWFNGFTSTGSFSFNTAGTYRVSCKVVTIKTNSIPGGWGEYLFLTQSNTITGSYDARQFHTSGPLNGNQDNALETPLQLDYVIVETSANTPWIFWTGIGGSTYYLDVWGGTTMYIEKLA